MSWLLLSVYFFPSYFRQYTWAWDRVSGMKFLYRQIINIDNIQDVARDSNGYFIKSGIATVIKGTIILVIPSSKFLFILPNNHELKRISALVQPDLLSFLVTSQWTKKIALCSWKLNIIMLAPEKYEVLHPFIFSVHVRNIRSLYGYPYNKTEGVPTQEFFYYHNLNSRSLIMGKTSLVNAYFHCFIFEIS